MLTAAFGLALPWLMVAAMPSIAWAQAPAPATQPIDVARAVRDRFVQDQQALATGTPAQRDEAARRLIARQTAESRTAILKALQQKDNQGAQLAAARAIPDDPTPDPRWITPLGNLMGIGGNVGGQERELTVAGAVALGSFHGTVADRNAAFGLLQRFINNPVNPPGKLSAIRALSVCTDYRIAELLVSLMQSPSEAERNNAADALQEMTQVTENGRDPRAWQAWWATQRNRPPEEFRADILERQRRRNVVGMTDVDKVVGQMFAMVDQKRQPAALEVPLDSADAPFRAAGIRLAWQYFNARGELPPAILPKVRELVRDSSPQVRIAAAKFLRDKNDRPSLEILLAQLLVDTDAEVRAAIMEPLVSMQDVRAVPTLLEILKDPSVRSATAAAETLAKLGPAIHKDAALQTTVSNELVKTINGRGNQNPDLKAACVEALVPLQMPQHRQLFESLLGQQQTPRMRIAAVAGLGELRDPNLGDVVFGVVQNDREQKVRYAALGAMATLQARGFAGQLLSVSLNPAEDKGIRDLAQHAFEAYLPLGSDEQLNNWSDQFLQSNAWARRVPVMKEQLTRAEKAKDPRAAAALDEAIGDAYVRLNQPQDAIPYLRAALDYWQNNKGSAAAQASPRRRLMTAHLMAKQYPQAAQLAQEAMSRDPALQEDVIPWIANEVDRLNEAKQPRDAQRLAEEGLKIPNLTERSRNWLIKGREAANQQLSPNPR
jgi:HEAT repeat protein